MKIRHMTKAAQENKLPIPSPVEGVCAKGMLIPGDRAESSSRAGLLNEPWRGAS